jgi:hypothetical protein
MSLCLETRIRRVFLPIAAIFPIIFIPQFHVVFDYIYFPIISGTVGFIIFWNFPFFVYMTASRPLYYEDLFIDEGKLPNYNINPQIKERFQCILLWVLIFTNSILVGALSDYWLYKTTGKDDFLAIIGITGGIIKIFQIVNNTVGRIMLKIIKKEIKMENNRFQEMEHNSIKNIVSLKQLEDGDMLNDIQLTEMNKNIIIAI